LRRALALVAFAAMILPGAALADGSASPTPYLTLTVLHNNDGESAVLPRVVDGNEYGGIANFAGVVATERLRGFLCQFFVPGSAGRCGSLLLNSGDNFLAGTTFQASRQEGAPFYDALAVRALSYDALAIGNHEFDFGPPVFAEFVEETGRTPFVSANLDFSAEPELQALEDAGRLRDSVILWRGGMKIGVFGLTTPTLPTISSPGGVVADGDLVTIAQAQADALKDEGAEIIIMQSHLQNISVETGIVSQVSGIDLVIAGGGGELLANPDDELVPGDVAQGGYPALATDLDGNEVPIVTTSGNYEYVGKLVVNFDRDGNLLEVLDSSGLVVVKSGVAPAVPYLEKRVEEPVREFVEGLAENVLAQSEVILDCERPDVRGGESNCGNLMADSMFAAATAQAPLFGLPVPDVAFQNGGGIRGEIDQPEGPFTEADTFRLAPFANFVSIAENVPSETFRQLLEEGAVRIGSGFDGGFVQAAGFSYTIDPSLPARVTDNDGNEITPGQRIVEVVLDDGTVVVSGGVATPGLTLTVASNDFSLAGGDAYPVLPFTRIGLSYQQALSSYVSSLGTITAADYPRGGEGRITILP
jgi:5'-nucleotidase